MSTAETLLWPVRQLRGWLANLWAAITGARLSDVLPPSWLSTLAFIRDSLPRSLGFTNSLTSQLTGVIVFAVVLVVASFTLLTYVAIVYALVFGTVALLRAIPAVNRRWPWTAGDWPLWEVR